MAPPAPSSGIRGRQRTARCTQTRNFIRSAATRASPRAWRGRSARPRSTKCRRHARIYSRQRSGEIVMPDSPTSSKDWLQAIRSDWDARAKENPRAYINWPEFADDDEAFFASGLQDYERYVPTFLKKMQFEPRGKAALEIGCGIGRIARWMSRDFGKYIGV